MLHNKSIIKYQNKTGLKAYHFWPFLDWEESSKSSNFFSLSQGPLSDPSWKLFCEACFFQVKIEDHLAPFSYFVKELYSSSYSYSFQTVNRRYVEND